MARKQRRQTQSKRKPRADGTRTAGASHSASRADRRALAHAEKRLVEALQELHEARLRVVRRERKLHDLRQRATGGAADSPLVPALIASPKADTSLADEVPPVEPSTPRDSVEAPDIDEDGALDEAATFDSVNSRPPSA